MDELLVSVLLILFFAGAVLGMVSFHRRLIRQPLDMLVDLVEKGVITGSFSGYTLKGVFQGRQVFITLKSGRQKDSPEQLTVGASAIIPFKCSIYSRSALLDLGSTIGLIRNVVKDIPEFQQRYVITSSDEMPVREFLLADKRRECVDGLLQGRSAKLVMERESITIVQSVRGLNLLKRLAEPSEIEAMLQILVELASDVERFSGNMPSGSSGSQG